MLIDVARGFTTRGISKFTKDVTRVLIFPWKRGITVAKDSVISA